MLIGIIWISFTACTGLKHISEQDPLLSSATVNFIEKPRTTDVRGLKNELADVNRPKPNSKLLWMRPFLAIYNLMGNPAKEKGLRNWIKTKIGRPPVRLSDVSPPDVSEAMENRLFNYGFFNGTAGYETERKNKTATVSYLVHPGANYKIDTLIFQEPENQIARIINENAGETIIRKNQPYNLKRLQEELERNESVLKDSGYYYFTKNYLKFKADTSGFNHGVRLRLMLKDNLPPVASKQMYIGDLYIHDNFSLDDYHPDTTEIDEIYFVSREMNTRPEIILDQVHLNPGDRYSRTMHFRTLNHLSSLGIYKYVNANFNADTTDNLLNTTIVMTPLLKNSISAELATVVKTTNFLGPGLNLRWRNRNLFRGGEMFTLNLNGSYETQVGTDSINTSLEAGIEFGLEIPRLIPFKLGDIAPEFIPVTNIRGGFRLFRRVELYNLSSFYGGFSYKWRQSHMINHNFSPIDLSFNRLSNQTPLFEEYLTTNPIVRRSFEEQFIIGATYSFGLDNRFKNKSHSVFFNQSIESSGFLSSLTFMTLENESKRDQQNRIFGLPYSQFIKGRTDIRNYFRVGRNNQLATRMIIGVGIPYGNSEVMPFVRQFFAGGTNSIRAFVSRRLGPGSFTPPIENLGVDRTGDIKLEANAEYRFNLTGLLKGAVFMDAGNVWLKNRDDARPGADFEIDRFYKEIAIGTGFGLRLDANFVVFRLDLAWPVRRPNLPMGERWVIGDWNILDKAWRRDNLLLNIAIGYPF